MSNIIASIMFVIGLLFNLLGCIGMVRLPDVYNRLQAATKCVTLGTCMVLLSVAILACSAGNCPLSIKCLICIVFVVITAPTAAHALARGAHSYGVKLWHKSVVDKYDEDDEPGTSGKEDA
jgi:multicomponent Na+:H+ antiporter subunit G